MSAVKKKSKLKPHLELEKVIDLITKEFLHLNIVDITPNIKDALCKLSKFLNAKCSYLVFLADDTETAGKSISWCSREHGYCSRYLNRYSTKLMPTFDKTIRSAKVVQIHDVNSLGDEWKHEKEIWQQNKVKAVICLPLTTENKVIGYVGFNFFKEQKKWRKGDLDLLTTFYEMISVSLDRQEKRKLIAEQANKPEKVLKEIINAVTAAIEKHDSYTATHQLRTAKLCVAIAKELKLKKTQIQNIYLGALIHDVGKIYLPTEMLNRPGSLSKLEMNLVRTHAQEGYNIVKDLLLDHAINEMILTHHERLDGSGYPRGLKGRQIKIGARILAVADSVEAIYAKRPYNPQRTMKETLNEIKKLSGKLYDQKVVEACVKLFEEKGFKFED